MANRMILNETSYHGAALFNILWMKSKSVALKKP